MATQDFPRWFDPAPYDRAEQHELTVAGARIAYRSGGTGPGPRILFVHGGRAHATWWAPQLALFGDTAPKWATIDLSGHGDSEWRADYRAALWLDELTAVAEALAAEDALVLVGHSLGGMLSTLLGAAGTVPNIRHIVAIDAVPLDPGTGPARPEPSTSKPSYPSLAEGAEAFSSRPARHGWPDWLATFIGERSLRPSDDGWAWRHDNASRIIDRPVIDDLGALDLDRYSLVTGTVSPFRESIEASRFVRHGGARLHRVEIDAGHDVMMERPEDFHRALRALLPG